MPNLPPNFDQAVNQAMADLERAADAGLIPRAIIRDNPVPRPEDMEPEDMHEQFLAEVDAVREERARGARIVQTRKSSATIHMNPRMAGALHLNINGGAGGQYFRKEDLAQFAMWLMEEAKKLALLEHAEQEGE
jgi:hypothetical protein